MCVTAIVGANWGDEGKGKMTDALAAQASYVVRYQGGSNAGHTVINAYGKFTLHLLPSGVFHPHVHNVIGPGVALSAESLKRELDGLAVRGVPTPTLHVSDRAQLVLPVHMLLDELEEARLGERRFGSTKQGIAPFYADKALKLGVQVADLFDDARLKSRVEAALEARNALLPALYGKPPVAADAMLDALKRAGEWLAPYVCDTTELLNRAWRRGESMVVEGQLGALRDLDHGIYPYSTSTSTLAGFAAVGAGLPPYAITRIVAVTKAYSSCVGEGPFVTEIGGAAAEELRRRGGDGGEYGATTGRPRRMGWFDAVATRYGCMVQGATEAALTNLDALSGREDIPICTEYEVDGVRTTQFPPSARLSRALPVLERLPGWREPLTEAREFAALPEAAQSYVLTVERLIGVPIRWISVGPRREQLIERTLQTEQMDVK